MTNIEEFPNGIKIYQNDEYRFTKDSIDLAKFCKIKQSDNVLEFCAGCGVISFYAYALNNFNKLFLNELQHSFCEVIEKNIKLNHLENKFVLLEGDLKNLKPNNFEKKFDVIICNPPYYKREDKDVTFKDVCKREITITLKEIIQKASELIKDKGKLYLCMTVDRSAELLGELYLFNFHAKRIKYLLNKNNEPYLILVEAGFNSKIGTKVIIE